MSLITFKSRSTIRGYKNSKLAKSETNDCVVCAIASAFGVTYNQAHKFAKETYGRKDRKGTITYKYHDLNDKFSDDSINILGSGKAFNKVEFEPVKVERKRCTRKSTYWNNSESYKYEKTLKLYTKRGSKYSEMTVGSFIKMFPKGTYILSVSGHTFTLKNGSVIGNYSDARKMRVRVEKAWEIK